MRIRGFTARAYIAAHSNTRGLEKAEDSFREVDYRVSAISANIPLYIDAKTLGGKGIFTKHEVDRATVPKGLCTYDIRFSSDTMMPDKLWPRVIGRRFGTVITKRPLPFGERGYTELGEYGVSLNPDKRLTLRDFQSKSRENER